MPSHSPRHARPTPRRGRRLRGVAAGALVVPIAAVLASPSVAAPVLRSTGLAPAMVPATAAGGSSGSTPTVPGGGFVSGPAAVDRLGDRLPAVARANGMSAASLRSAVLADPTLAVDRQLGLAYFDVAADAGATQAGADASTAAAPATDGPEFQLSSLPGAAKTIYLDFDGNTTTGTSWNTAYGVSTIESPPYDTDGNPGAFSSAELKVVRDTWAVVAEDFAPWNVNVTTVDPGSAALSRSGSGDTTWGVRVVVTDDTFASCGCGGHAYVGAFDDATDEPAFVYNTSFRGVSEAASHEVGHTLGLAHDGTTTGDTYYTGHGSGETSWAPIMGAGYYVNTTQWSRQEYTNANNADSAANYGNGADDTAIIGSLTNGNGFGLRPDDHGDTAAAATPLTGPSASVGGRISTRDDVDVFSMTTGGGSVTVAVTPPAAPVADLDASLTVRNASGTVVGSADPAATHAASLTTSLPAGTYSVTVDGVGAGSPGATPPTGYTDYGSLGTYTLTVSFTPGGTADTTPPAAPAGLAATVAGSGVDLTWTANTEPDLASYVVARAASTAGPFTELATVTAPSTAWTDPTPLSGTNAYVVRAVDTSGNRSVASAPATAEITPPSSGSVAEGELAVAGTVAGSYTATRAADGIVESVTEVVSGGKPSQRHDTLEHRWSFSAPSGGIDLRVVAATLDGGDADGGIRLDWSRDGSTWVPVTTVDGAVDGSFPLGTATGTVWVRAVDTDATAGQLSPDTLSVDLLRLDGGPVVEPTSAVVTGFTVGTAAAAKGSVYGTVTVTVADELGTPVAGARVSLQFSGAWTDAPVVTTNTAGVASYTTSTAQRKPSFSVCLTGVSAGGLTYAGGEVCRAS